MTTFCGTSRAIQMSLTLHACFGVLAGDVGAPLLDLLDDIRFVPELPSSSAGHWLRVPTNAHEVVEDFSRLHPRFYGAEYG